MAEKLRVSLEEQRAKHIESTDNLSTTGATEILSSISTEQPTTVNSNNGNNNINGKTSATSSSDIAPLPLTEKSLGAESTLENDKGYINSNNINGCDKNDNEMGNHQDNTSIDNNNSKDREQEKVTATEPPQVHPLVAQLRAQLYQQRHVLDNLEVERSQYKLDSQNLQERLAQMNSKIQQRSEARQQLENNYREHLQSMRATPDDLDSISLKLKHLKKKIRELADELLEQADPVTATRALRVFWLNLHDCIEAMGNPLPLHRVRMLTEKFMMDVLVQNMNLNVFPGLSISEDYNEISFWLEKYDLNQTNNAGGGGFATRLRQEMALVMARNNTNGTDIHKKMHEAVQNNWKFLYGGLIKAYPFVYQFDKHEPNTRLHYGAKVQELVELSMAIGFAMKGQEVDVAAAETRERVQTFDSSMMVDEDGQTSGVVDFCVCPPFVVYGPKVYTLEKGRVLCSSSSTNAAINTSNTNNNENNKDLPKDIKDAYLSNTTTTTTATANNSIPASTTIST